MSGARLCVGAIAYSEVENRKKGDVFLKALPRHTIKGNTQILMDSIAFDLSCFVLVVMPLKVLLRMRHTIGARRKVFAAHGCRISLHQISQASYSGQS